jgi:amino acid transporter
MVTVTAFEARTMRSLRLPSQSISYVVFALYFLCTIGEALNVDWMNKNLPFIDDGSHIKSPPLTNPASSTLPIIATWQAGHHKLAGVINGLLIFSVLSASNTALYTASRTLYGMTREVPTSNTVGRILKKFSLVVPQTGVPAAALAISAIAFLWLPCIALDAGYAVQDVRIPMILCLQSRY